MANPFQNRATGGLENECVEICGWIALDGSSNVIGFAPTATPINLQGPYTRFRGLQKAIGPAGGIVTQPHTAVGVFLFTLDEPWFGCLEAWAQLSDQGAVAVINAYFDVNVTASTGSTSLGYFPGQDQTLPAQTVRVRFRNNAGALTDPVANSKFWMGMVLKRNAPT